MTSKPPSKIEAAAFAFTKWVGSPQSVLVHTVIFAATIGILVSHVFPFDVVILIFNTAVSLEAIYLAVFIQMTVNRQAESLIEVEHDIDEMQEDIDEIQKDVDEIQEDVEELSEEEHIVPETGSRPTLADIHARLTKLLHDIERLEQQP